MSIPAFGWYLKERRACNAMILSGIVGLAFTTVAGPPPYSSFPEIGRAWLLLQATLVIAGGGSGAFAIKVVGIVAGLLVFTPVGILTFLPTLWVLRLLWPRRRAFWSKGLPSGFGRPPATDKKNQRLH